MGALHQGHLSLIRAAREQECVIASIFVNPLQFGQGEDFSKYPRTIEADSQLLQEQGADILFLPDPDDLELDSPIQVTVSGNLSEKWEGSIRPGHFKGVATIVTKLFHLVEPTHAYFGLKDLQQCAVIRQLVKGLNFPIELRFQETIREPSGLALSSRNSYFSDEDRQAASQLYQALCQVRESYRSDRDSLAKLLQAAESDLVKKDFHIEYLELVDKSISKELFEVTNTARLIVAARFKGVRLIDNIAI